MGEAKSANFLHFLHICCVADFTHSWHRITLEHQPFLQACERIGTFFLLEAMTPKIVLKMSLTLTLSSMLNVTVFLLENILTTDA